MAAMVLWEAGYDTLLIAEAIGAEEAAVYNSLSVARDTENERRYGEAHRERLAQAQEHEPVQGYVYPTYPKMDHQSEGRSVGKSLDQEDTGNGA